MKNIFISTFILFIIACNNNDVIKTSTDSLVNTKDTLVTKPKTEREILIEELKKLKATLTTNDKEKIASLFEFPFPFAIYSNDENFEKDVKANNGDISKEIFIKYYKDVEESLWLREMNNFFKFIDDDNLITKDTLNTENIIKANPCYYSYEITINKSTVKILLTSNSNREFETTVSEDEIPENDSSICEHSLWWVFNFEGKKLHIEQISGAG